MTDLKKVKEAVNKLGFVYLKDLTTQKRKKFKNELDDIFPKKLKLSKKLITGILLIMAADCDYDINEILTMFLSKSNLLEGQTLFKKNNLKGKGLWGDIGRFITQKAFDVGKTLTKPVIQLLQKAPILQPRLDRFNNTTQKSLNLDGNVKITKIEIVKTPISEKLNVVLNAVSYGKWKELMKKNGFDKFYHLGLVITLQNKHKYIMEKNEEIFVSPKWDENINKDTQYLQIPLKGANMSLNEMLMKTQKIMGEFKFFDYHAFTNNCQVFVREVLQANELLTPGITNFIFQNVGKMTQELPSYVGEFAHGITRFANVFGKLIGTGIATEREIPENFGEETLDVFEDIIFPNGDLQLFGSMKYRSIFFGSDYDLYEIVRVQSLAKLEGKFKSMVKKLIDREDTFITDIKLGSDEKLRLFDEYNFFYQDKSRIYDAKKFKSAINDFYSKNYITKAQRDYAKKLLVDNPSQDDLHKIKKEIRFHILRWSPQEILDGEKTLPGGRKITLQEAFKSPALFKMDLVALLNGRFVEFSIIYELRNKNGKRLNNYRVDLVKSLKEDISHYKADGNYMKAMKRKFSLLMIKNKQEPTKALDTKLKKYVEIFNSDIGILKLVATDIEILIQLLEINHKNMSIKDINNEISSFVNRLANVYNIQDYLKKEKNYLRQINEAMRTKSKDKKLKILHSLYEDFGKIINNEIKKLMDKGEISV